MFELLTLFLGFSGRVVQSLIILNFLSKYGSLVLSNIDNNRRDLLDNDIYARHLLELSSESLPQLRAMFFVVKTFSCLNITIIRAI